MSLSIRIIEETPTEKKMEATVDLESSHGYFIRAASFLAQQSPLKGFRPGKAPFDLCLRAFGNAKILQEVMRLVLYEQLPAILQKETARILGEPLIRFTAIENREPIVFMISIGKYPEHLVLDYRTIAIKEKRQGASDQEVMCALDLLQKERDAKTIDDAFAQSLGNFTNLADLKNAIKEQLRVDKEAFLRERARARLLDAIKKHTSLALPRFVVEQETEKRINSSKKRLEAKGRTWADHLKTIQKSEEDVRRIEAEAVKRLLEHALILEEIARQEHIVVDVKEVESAFNDLLLHYHNPKETKQSIDIPSTKEKITWRILYEKVFQQVLDKKIEYI